MQSILLIKLGLLYVYSIIQLNKAHNKLIKEFEFWQIYLLNQRICLRAIQFYLK